MLKLFIGISVFYLSMTTVVFLKQRSLLYQPSNRGLTSAQAERLMLKKWPDVANYRGYLREPPIAVRTIVIFHGNAGEAADRNYYLTALAAFNARVLLVEYPGYGTRSGKPSEDVFVSDARTTLKLLADAFPDEPIIVVGESMGTGVVAAAVTRLQESENSDIPTIQGMVLITPWDSLANLAQTHYWYLPARWLVLDRYDSVRNLQSFKEPKAIVIAGQDQIIPPMHGNRLFEEIPSAKERFMLNLARHNDWLNYVDNSWWQDLMRFVTSEAEASTKQQ